MGQNVKSQRHTEQKLDLKVSHVYIKENKNTQKNETMHLLTKINTETNRDKRSK